MENGKDEAPRGRRSVTPHLVVRGAAEALAFYAEALGAEELSRMPGPDGKLMHASMAIGDALVYLCDEFPNSCVTSPQALGGTSVTFHLAVEDVDASFARAVAAGATAIMPPADMFWGDRYAQVSDPFGHRWSLATPVATGAAPAERIAEAQPA